MNRILLFLALMGAGQAVHAQYVYTIKADSVKITNNCDTAELIIENHTQTVPGFLYNRGRGRTEFRRGAIKINDTTYVVGDDTMKVMPPNRAWLTNGNANINSNENFLGTLDAASLAFRTNNTERARVDGTTGNVMIGSSNDNGAKLQVYGKQTIYGNEDVTQLGIRLPASPAITTPIVQVQNNNGSSLFDLRVDSTSLSLGAGAGGNSQSGSNANIAIGTSAMASNTTGQCNFAAGIRTLYSNTTGSHNIAIGNGGPALLNNTTGNFNIGLGTDALANNTTGVANIGIGVNPMKFNTTGNHNVALGYGALCYATTPSYNVAIGGGALGASLSRTTTSQNVAIGMGAAQQQQIGLNNIFIGYFTNFAYAAGDNNSIIGANSFTVGGSNNILLGAGSYINGVTNTILIGQGLQNCTRSNLVVLGRGDQNTLIGTDAGFTDNGARLQVLGSQTTSSNIGVGGVTTMTGKVHIAASNGSAGTAPIKLTAGAILSTPEAGAIEFDGTDLYLTENSARYKLSKTVGDQITTNFGGISLSAFTPVTTTLTVTGAQPGDVVSVSTGSANPAAIMVTAYVTSANTVTLRAYNASNGAVTIASDTYKVRVIK